MFTKFKSALYSAVGGLELPQLPDVGDSRQPKFRYSRPAFLQLNSEDEITVAGDRTIRPIIVPRDLDRMPWVSGYAEAVNAGKSKRNEDNGCVQVGLLQQSGPAGSTNGHQSVPSGPDTAGGDAPPDSPLNGHTDAVRSRSGSGARKSLKYYYFALFDGHAGYGASVAAANQLQHILHERLVDVIDHLLPPDETAADQDAQKRRPTFMWIPAEAVSVDKLVVGALEAAFHDMDTLIGEDRVKFDMRGGCTALVGLFILGKLYVANAGDSRATLCRRGRCDRSTHDFTPETERQRIRKLGIEQPSLLGGEFTSVDFCRRVGTRDLGQRVLYRDPHMTGWAYRTVAQHDLRFPLICGEGKRSRVCATIGVTRGFGDHDLRAQNTSVQIKPFLSSQPEVLVVDIDGDDDITPSDCLVMGTDGLWDVLSNERVAALVEQSLSQFPAGDPNTARCRYTGAAQDLVMAARGKLKDRLWRQNDGSPATIDDISVFVIPLLPYKQQHLLWKFEMNPVSRASSLLSTPVDGLVCNGVRAAATGDALARYQTLVEQCGKSDPSRPHPDGKSDPSRPHPDGKSDPSRLHPDGKSDPSRPHPDGKSDPAATPAGPDADATSSGDHNTVLVPNRDAVDGER